MFGAGKTVMVAGRGRMREVALLDKMHGALEEFTRSGDERPEEQRRDSDGCKAIHRA